MAHDGTEELAQHTFSLFGTERKDLACNDSAWYGTEIQNLQPEYQNLGIKLLIPEP